MAFAEVRILTHGLGSYTQQIRFRAERPLVTLWTVSLTEESFLIGGILVAFGHETLNRVLEKSIS